MKKYFLIALLAFVVLTFTGCGQIEDTNGEENFDLVTITDQNIIEGMNVVTFASVKTASGNKESLSVGKLSGVLDLYTGTAAGETVILTVDCNATAGNARLVMVYDGKIVHEFDLHKQGQKFVLENAKGDFALKIAGESAAFEVVFEIGE